MKVAHAVPRSSPKKSNRPALASKPGHDVVLWESDHIAKPSDFDCAAKPLKSNRTAWLSESTQGRPVRGFPAMPSGSECPAGAYKSRPDLTGTDAAGPSESKLYYHTA